MLSSGLATRFGLAWDKVTRWRRWPARLRWMERPARVAAQTATAALTTFALFKITGLPQVSWAVISALFVIQPNVGGTISTALGRVAGTMLGTAIGLACVFLIGASTWAVALGLLVATAGLSFITDVRPGLRYGLVPAAFILLAPGGEVVEKAWEGATAISIGALIGALTGLVVLPEPAHRAAERHLGEAIRHAADLLAATVESLTGESCSNPIQAASDAIETEIWTVGGLTAQSRYPSRARRSPTHPRPRELLRAAERLWHSLLLMTRIDEAPLPEDVRRELAPRLKAFAEVGGDYLRSLSEALESDLPPPSPEPSGEQIEKLNETLGSLRRRGATRPLESREAARIFTLAFAVQELGRNFAEIAGLFSRPGDR
jgi:uncharacterized membrane protein YccC